MPMLSLPTDEQKAEQQRLTDAIQDLTGALADNNVAPPQQEWEKTLSGRMAVSPVKGITAHYEFDGNMSDSSGQYRRARTLNGDPVFIGGMVNRAVSLDGQTMLGFGDAGSFDSADPFTFALWMRPGIGKISTVALQKIEDEKTRRKDAARIRIDFRGSAFDRYPASRRALDRQADLELARQRDRRPHESVVQ
jgi:hypothetical protein